MRGIPLRQIIASVLLILGFGLVRLPLERRLEGQLRGAGYLEDNVELSMMETLGQRAFAAALGGSSALCRARYDTARDCSPDHHQ